ncbi:MAG TPA: FAD-dependent oxidoreductase [Thermoleophilaceae bacterium]|nr:FAD-dependent oxidoreductase [Thermoleophilaceae bacterium]
MSLKMIRGEGEGPLRVLIAGGGVAGLEALLALHRLAGARVHVELLEPQSHFAYRPLAVAEPFGLAHPARIDVSDLAAAHGARHLRDGVSSVEPERHGLHTQRGRTLRYDALLLAVGTAAVEAVDGALTFRGPADVRAFGELLEEVRSGDVSRVAFALHPKARWPLPLYELALLSAAHTAPLSGGEVEWTLVTHESAPLEVFGDRASGLVGELLENAGVRVMTSCVPSSARGGPLVLESGETIDVERVVALPELRVPYLPGVPRGAGGFIPTDDHQRVKGLEGVFAAGDATSFPIKQGGIAAQQADAAAAAIAALAGAEVDTRPPDLLLRAALLTGSAPRFLRAALDDRDATSTAGSSVLWWPPGKIAARYLAPYLAGRAGSGEPPPLDDVEARFGEEPEAAEADRGAALELALTSADADADWGDFEAALRWLDVAERLNVVLPRGYAEKRERWGRSFANS